MVKLRSTLLILAMSLPCPLWAQGLINGSFEQDATGWTLAGNVHIQSTGTFFVARDGVKLVAFNDGQTIPNGTVTQTLTTVIGHIYTITASVGAVAGVTGAASQSMRISALDGTVSLATLSVTLAPTPATTWADKTLVFTATSTATAIQFQDITVTTTNADLVLDKISVTDAAVPLPDPCAAGTQATIITGGAPKVAWQQPKQRPVSSTDPTMVPEVTEWFTFTFDATMPMTAMNLQPTTTCPNGMWGYIWPIPSSVTLIPGTHTLKLSAGNTRIDGVKQEGAATIATFMVADPGPITVPPTAPLNVRIVP